MRLRKTAALFLVLVLFISVLSGCSRGVRGIDGIAWNEYDELIDQIRTETDPQTRESLLHRAEDMLMKTECVTPLFNYRDAYLQKNTLTGVFGTHYGAKFFMYSVSGDTSVSAYLGQLPDSVDPALASTTVELTIVENTFSGLYTHDADGKIVPALAEGCEVSEDGITYTFTLREGLLWSDGSKLGASDFIFSWRRAADASTGSPYRYLFNIIARNEDGKLEITADGSDTVLTVKLARPCGYFTELCAFPAFYPVNEACVESAEGYMDIYNNIIDPDAWTIRANYVTSGAFTFSGTADGKYIYKKNGNFYNAGAMSVDRFEAIFGNDADTQYEKYESGELDYLGVIPSDRHDELMGGEEYHSDNVNGVYFLAYNFNCRAFSGMNADKAAQLRRAISLFIDREYIISSVTKNGETAATSVVPDGTLSLGSKYKRNTADHTYPFPDERGYFAASTETNRAEAREIIKSLGMDEDGDGMIDAEHRFTLLYLTTNSATDIATAQSIQQDLAELGIMVKVTAAEPRVFDFELSIYNYDVIAVGSVSYYDDAQSTLECWMTDAQGNYAHLGSVAEEENENAY